MKYLKTYGENCIGCNTCITVCSTLYFKEDNPEKSRIKVFSEGEENFKLSVCNQCQSCVSECQVKALNVNKQGVVMVNKNLCIGCLVCVAVCPTFTMRYHHEDMTPFKCIACGACARECPADALEIVIEED